MHDTNTRTIIEPNKHIVSLNGSYNGYEICPRPIENGFQPPREPPRLLYYFPASSFRYATLSVFLFFAISSIVG